MTQRELPSSTDIAGVNMRLTAGSYREMHWHTADEWAYVLYGKARVTVMSPDGKMYIADVGEGDLWIFPAVILIPSRDSIPMARNSCSSFFFTTRQFLGGRNHVAFGVGGAYADRSLDEELRPRSRGFGQASDGALYIFPGAAPANSVAHDMDLIGGSAVASPYQFTLRLKSMAPTKSTPHGEVRVVDSRNFPVSKHVAAPWSRSSRAECASCTGIPTPRNGSSGSPARDA